MPRLLRTSSKTETREQAQTTLASRHTPTTGAPQQGRRGAPSLGPDQVLQMQQSQGNRAVQRMLDRSRASTQTGVVQLVSDDARRKEIETRLHDLERDPHTLPSYLSVDQFMKLEEDLAGELGSLPAATDFDPEQRYSKTDTASFKFDPAKVKQDWQALLTRIAPIKALNNDTFKGLFIYYIEALSNDDKTRAAFAIIQISDYLDSISGFAVSREDTKKNQEFSDFPPLFKLMQELTAEVSSRHGQLWSKLNLYIAYELAKQEGGVSLERSLAGKMFNGLNFGTTGDVMSPQWTALSARFVRGLHGEVHAHAFEGTVTNSVFYHTEWPRLKALMSEGAVTRVIIHVYRRVRPDCFLTEQRTLDEISTHEFTDANKEELEKTLIAMDDAWKASQGKAHGYEEFLHGTQKGIRDCKDPPLVPEPLV